MLARTIFVAAAVFAAAPVSAWVGPSTPRYTLEELQMFHREHLKNLREEILAQQQAEGGKLSQASHTRFQSRLDKLNRDYQVTLRRYDPFSVDGFGMPVERTYSQ